MSNQCYNQQISMEQSISALAPPATLLAQLNRGERLSEFYPTTGPSIGLTTSFTPIFGIQLVPIERVLVYVEWCFMAYYGGVEAITAQVSYNGVTSQVFQDGGHYQLASAYGNEKVRVSSYFSIDVPLSEGDCTVLLSLKTQGGGGGAFFQSSSNPAFRAWSNLLYWRDLRL